MTLNSWRIGSTHIGPTHIISDNPALVDSFALTERGRRGKNAAEVRTRVVSRCNNAQRRGVHDAPRQSGADELRRSVRSVGVGWLDLGEGSRLGRLPDGLVVPDDVRFDQVQAPPMHPELILDLCLNSSVPLPPMEYSPLRRFRPSEMGHAMACYRSLGMAVDLLEGVELERGAASAWNAFSFVLDLGSCFKEYLLVCLALGGVFEQVFVVDEPIPRQCGYQCDFIMHCGSYLSLPAFFGLVFSMALI